MRCVVIDFDGTLASFTNGLEGSIGMFVKQGIPEHIVRENYEEVRDRKGFSINNLYDALSAKGFSLNKDALESEFEESVQRDLTLYPESMEAMENLKKQEIPVVVLTAGEKTTQKRKVAATQILYDELVIVPTAKEKVAALTFLLEKYGKPVVVFDDRADILDLIHEEFKDSSDVVTVWVHRVTSDFPRGKYEHIEIKDLSMESLAKVIS